MPEPEPATVQLVPPDRVVFLGMTINQIRELVSHAGLAILGAWCLANLLIGHHP